MLGWILGSIATVVVIGYIAHKFPTMFGTAVDAGAAVVNKVDDSVKAEVTKATSNTAS